MQIKPIASLSRDEIRDLAYAAAERGEHKADSNPFQPGTAEFAHFEHDHLQRERDLVPVD